MGMGGGGRGLVEVRAGRRSASRGHRRAADEPPPVSLPGAHPAPRRTPHSAVTFITEDGLVTAVGVLVGPAVH